MKSKELRKGRGAQANPHNKFLEHIHEIRGDFLEYCRLEGLEPEQRQTRYLPVFPRTIVNKVTSPDVGMNYSLNPYQGCEHGCVYCYARNTHEFWGYSAGLDFERTVLVKEEAAALLEKKLRSRGWQPETIVLSGNTDCYQPAERKYRLTRSCLEVFLKYRHPVGIITKNSLILRDLDLLKALNERQLIGVHVSVTTLSEDTRRLLEPRTASIGQRLKTIESLAAAGIPVNAMLAPVIPGINSHEIPRLARKVSEAGAISFAHTVVRLNGAIGGIFTDWLKRAMPDRAEKVLEQIRSCHGGRLNDSRFGIRARGEGQIAQQIRDMATIARKRYFHGKKFPNLNKSAFHLPEEGQLRLF